MKLAPLLKRFGDSPALRELVALIKREGSVQAPAMVEAARPAVAAYLTRHLSGSLIFVTSHPHRADYLVGELAPWLEIPVELFPAFESLPYERVSVDRETLARRQAVVNRVHTERTAVVVSIRSLMQSVHVSPALKSIALAVGSDLDMDGMTQSLLAGGYEAASIVEEPGEYARRGGIFDIFPIGTSHPVRVEMLGNQIESLRIFDPVSQRSLGEMTSASISPMQSLDSTSVAAAVAELDGLKTDGMNDASLARWSQDVEGLRTGELDTAHFFNSYLNGECTLLDAAHAGAEPRVVVVCEDAGEIRRAAKDLLKQADEVQQELVSAGELPRGLRPALVSLDTIERKLARSILVEMNQGGDEHSVEGRVFSRPPGYGGRIRSFIHSLDPAQRPEAAFDQSSALVITSYQYARLAELLQDENLPVTVVDGLCDAPEPGTVTIVKGSLAQGWTAPSLGLDLFTDHEIFGWSKPRVTPRRKRAAREAFFTEFAAGDHVVHVEHGIGQLVGTSKMGDGGVEHEYLVIQYAGTDRLYVPTDQLDRLTRYVGMGDASPHLNRLGGQEWTRAKARAKQAAEDMAEELIALYAQREASGGHAFMPDMPWQHELEVSFPFEETIDQMQAIVDVKSDMEQARPMDRLVVADVGYGKTEVAIRAAFKAVLDGTQAAVLVPTTVLAQQHMETFRERLEAFPVRIELLSRFRSPKEQRETLGRVRAGEVDIVIGTHRLLGKDVQFKNLGLLVVDEEQRFGVRHKERLKRLRAAVDVLTLTATPIPRTLHMSLTGIRDVSIIQTPPEGRLPIETYLQPYEDRLVRQAVIRELEREGQVYFVHNRVAGIEALAEKIRRLVPEARVLVGHGQLPEEELEKVMLTFSHQEADVLLCSTIIESGLDIPNVNTIIIDHAESLGLAQLYQLRGRVGRGVNQAYAYLLHPRDSRIGKDAMRRMEAVFEATELGAGFRIAMADLEIRGAGNLLGAEQSGHVAAIGFDLYTKLLRDAVDRMRGRTQIEPPHVTVDFPFDVLIPGAYVQDERERLALYRRLTTLTAEDGTRAFEDELRDRFGPPPPAVRNLITQVEVKFLAERAHVATAQLRGDRLTIKGEPRILYDRVALYKRFGLAARIDQSTLRVDANALGADWLQSVKDILTDTAALRERQEGLMARPTEAPAS